MALAQMELDGPALLIVCGRHKQRLARGGGVVAAEQVATFPRGTMADRDKEKIRELQTELEQYRKMLDQPLMYGNLVFTVNTSHGFRRGTFGECLAFVTETFAAAFRQAADMAETPGTQYYVNLQVFDVVAQRK